MTDNYNELFDRKIKESLLDAEERVPANVWKGVRGRLPAGSQSSFDWRRAGLVAVAAALCTCFVLIGTFVRRGVSAPQSMALQQVTVSPPSTDGRTAILADIPSANTEMEIAGDSFTKLVISARSEVITESSYAVMPESSVSEIGRDLAATATKEDSEVAEAPASVDGEETVSKSVTEKSESKAGSNYNNGTASLYRWITEDENASKEKETHRICLDAKGSFSTNRSNLKLGSSGIQGSPVIATGGIEPLSDSSFGIPLTFGVGVRWYLGKRFALGTGVDYTLLTRSFTGNYYPVGEGDIMMNANIHHSLSYIGIPVNAYFDIIQHSLVGLYVFGGAEIERAVANNYRISDSYATQYYSEAVCGCQYSAQLGLGVEFKITDFMGVYFDPCLKFYFNSEQPTSMRTQQPLMFSGAIGLKFDLKKQ